MLQQNAANCLFADIDTDGNRQTDAVGISGGGLGATTVVPNDWTVATLVGQGFPSTDHPVKGGWLV